MAMRIQLRRGTATQWVGINPILAEGEAGVDTTSHRIKFGDGINTWNNLPYSTMTEDEVYASVVDAIADNATVVDAAAAAVDANPTIASHTAAIARVDPGTAGAQRKRLGWRNGGPAWLDDSVVNVMDFGAVGDGVTDDTAAIQAAVDFADTLIRYTGASFAGVPNVFFHPGRYLYSSTLTKRAATWVGAGPNHGTRLLWAGGSGTAVVQDPTFPGGASFGGIRDLTFGTAPGQLNPDTWLDLTKKLVDVLYQLEGIHFGNCNGDAIKVGAWINLHWSHLRWDNPGGYAIHLAPDPGQFNSSFVLDQFTYDHSRTTGPARGFIKIDNSAGPSPGIGTFALTNARIEVNQPWTGEQAIVHLKHAETTWPGTFPITLSRIAYQNVIGMASDCVIYRDTTNTTTAENITLADCVFADVSTLFAGTWPTTWSAPVPLPPGGRVRLIMLGSRTAIGGTSLDIYNGSSATAAIRSYLPSETQPRFNLVPDGKHEWSSGSAAADVNLYRRAADQLRTDDKLIASLGIGVGNSAAATTPGAVVRKMEVFDAAGASLGFVAIYSVIT